MDLETLLSSRRSQRHFDGRSMTLTALHSLLWAAQGELDDGHRRTCPSAGGSYPLQLRVVAERVRGLTRGLYDYLPRGRSLQPAPPRETDRDPPGTAELAPMLFGDQQWVVDAAAIVLVSGRERRLAGRFSTQPPPERWRRYLWMECGAAAQNAALAAAVNGLGMTLVGGFDDARVARLAGVDPNEAMPLCLLIVGNPVRE